MTTVTASDIGADLLKVTVTYFPN